MFRRSRHFTHPHKLSSSSSLQLLFSGSMLGKQHLLRGCPWTCTKRQPKQAALIRRSYWWDCTGDCEQWGSLNVKIIFQKFHKLMRCAAKYFDLADVMESGDGRKGAMENFVKRSLLRFCSIVFEFSRNQNREKPAKVFPRPIFKILSSLTVAIRHRALTVYVIALESSSSWSHARVVRKLCIPWLCWEFLPGTGCTLVIICLS